MVAGSYFDPELVISEFPTILVGSIGLMVFKIFALGLATRVPEQFEPNRLSLADGIRVTLLLAGGGELGEEASLLRTICPGMAPVTSRPALISLAKRSSRS